MKGTKRVYEYENFRTFLKDTYLAAKARNKKFSFRYFARISGFKSPSFLKLVMDGKANLSRKSIGKIAAALSLTKEEALFFRSLVLFNQATSTEEKQVYATQILKSHHYKRIHPITEAQFNYYTHWYFIPVRELVSLAEFQEDPEWVAKKIQPSITAADASKALKELQTLGLLTRDSGGRLTVSNPNINTPNEVASQAIAQYHREMMRLAAESIDRHPRTRREISSLTMSVSEPMAVAVKERIQAFRAELVSLISQDEETDRVYQLNFQFFPLTLTPPERNSDG
jgi:uncharacterized protein (TIGR02147 family)